MKLREEIALRAGGPGSGCNPDKGKCGRPKLSSDKYMATQQRKGLAWAKKELARLKKAGEKKDIAEHHVLSSLGKKFNIGTERYVRETLGLKYLDISQGKEVGEDDGDEIDGMGEPEAGANTWSVIEPRSTFHPPSLKNPQRVPADNPGEKDDRFMDVTKRKQAHNDKMKLLKRSVPGGNPPMIPVTTTAVGHHMGVFQHGMLGSARKQRLIQRPAKMDSGVKRTFIPYSRRGSA